ncbi:hypothetical protein [Lysobacter gummosus]|uniref:hypothetical protein n=1 Tax=Lysobacter gummosus TaxID=262324 RepID=UPI0036271A2A
MLRAVSALRKTCGIKSRAGESENSVRGDRQPGKRTLAGGSRALNGANSTRKRAKPPVELGGRCQRAVMWVGFGGGWGGSIAGFRPKRPRAGSGARAIAAGACARRTRTGRAWAGDRSGNWAATSSRRQSRSTLRLSTSQIGT